MRHALVTISAFLICASVHGQDVMTRTGRATDPLVSMGHGKAASYSVISGLSSPYLPLTMTSVQLLYKDESDARVPQEGDGLLQGAFNAESFIRLDGRSVVTGKVSYQRGTRRNVIWNESSDYELLRPYVLADSVGGDLQREQYAFRGGWAAAVGNTRLGIEGSYRALHEYRDVDPRPRNICSDLHAKVSAGRDIGAVGLDLACGYRKYSQSESIVFLNQKGANTSIFHMTGLGSHYSRFEGTGTFSNTGYRGNGFEARLLAHPVSGERWIAGLSWSGTNISNHLMSQNEAPITSLSKQDAEIFTAFKWHRETRDFGIMGRMGHELRQGDEIVIDNNATGVYLDLLSLPQYTERVYDAGLEGFIRWRRPCGSWSISPSAALHSTSAEIRYPARVMRYMSAVPGLALGYSSARGLWLVRADASLSADINIDKNLKLPLKHTQEAFRKAYTHMYERLTDDYIHAGLGVFAQRAVSDTLAVFLRVEASGRSFSSGEHGTTLSLSIGTSF